MFVTDAMIAEMEQRYGAPRLQEFRLITAAQELARIQGSQKHGRNHDVTLYIRKGDQYIVISKHTYPPGLYRAPSGGVHPGETILEGINREAREETGCDIEVEKFLLRTAVQFEAANTTLHWRSFIFSARYVSGDFNFTDTHEIREVRLAGLKEFEKYGRIMRSVPSAGLRYRAELHEAVLPLL